MVSRVSLCFWCTLASQGFPPRFHAVFCYFLGATRLPAVFGGFRLRPFFFTGLFVVCFICVNTSENSKPNNSLSLASRAGNTIALPTVESSATILSANATTALFLPPFVFLCAYPIVYPRANPAESAPKLQTKGSF